MRTEEYLNQIHKFDRMIDNRMLDIGRLRAIATSTTIPPKDVNVKTSSDKDKMGNIVTRIVELEKEVNTLIDKRHIILQQIENMADYKEYDVLWQRYVQMKSIKEIKIEKISSIRRVQQILSNAIKNFESMYGKEYI